MEDDIDIEEHDVLDNPRIRNIFGPDLTQIKAEIPDEDYFDSDQPMGYEHYLEEENETSQDNDANAAEYARCGNKIILGSRPVSTSSLQIREDIQNGESVLIFGRKAVEVKKEIDEYKEDEPLIEENDEHILGDETLEEFNNHTSNIIIIGSKPSSSGFIEPFRANRMSISSDVSAKTKSLEKDTITNEKNSKSNIDRDPSKAFVSLENWGPRLESSSCYCKECHTLFATPNTLDAHNMTVHSFLVALDKNKAIKSTAKPNSETKQDKSGKFCNHCNKMFPDSDSLINHLYEKLTFDKKNPKKSTYKYQPKKTVAAPSESQTKIILGKNQNAGHSSNILGKNKNFAESSVENVDSHAEVDYFRCDVCSCYFQMYQNYQKHMKESHMQSSVRKEKVYFDGNCIHCKSKSKRKIIYNHHVRTQHSDLYFLKEDKLPIVIKIPKSSVTKTEGKISNQPEVKPKILKTEVPPLKIGHYQCQLCRKTFSSHSVAKYHKVKQHSEIKGQIVIKKIKQTKSLEHSSSKSPNKVSTPSKPPSPLKKIVVPKGILFKCEKCDIHFTSCMAVVLHSKSCTKQAGDWKCKICNRYFQTFDQFVHRIQHNVSEEFKVIKCYENIYGRVLNQCPNCKLYFHEKYFYLHVQKSPCNRASIKCGQCTLSIHASSAEEHIKWHKRIQTTKRNAILVEFATSIANAPSVPVKRNIFDDQPEIPTKKTKVEIPDMTHKLLVRYCQVCCCYFFGNNKLSRHLSGECENDNAVKQFCKSCGLFYSCRSHPRFHKTNPRVTLMDMRFLTIQTEEAIAPPIPDFPRCTKCKVHFCKSTTIDAHSCKDSYKTCNQCQMRFSDLAFKLHRRFHEYHKMLIKPQLKSPQSAQPKSKPALQDPLSELIKKYEKLTDTWNILFLCRTCDIVCDNYDQTIEHCQKHFNNMQSYDMIVEHCRTCGLQFDSTSFGRHEELHAQNESLTKDSFRILPYEYTNLLTSKWKDQFNSLPDTQMDQIVSRSIYQYGHSVKLRVVQEGPPETTVYKCGQCDLAIFPKTLTYHRDDTNLCIKKMLKYKCRLCDIIFCSTTSRHQHEKMHKTAQVFKIVYFGEDGDEQFNKTLKNNERNERSLGAKRATLIKFFKCESCKTCMLYKNIARHTCKRKSSKIYCDICKLYFPTKSMFAHKELHDRNPNLNRKNIRIFTKPPVQSSATAAKTERKDIVSLFKCECGLHFISRKALSIHFTVCETDTNIANEKCSKCQLLFDTAQLVSHLCNHHSKRNTRNEFKIIKVLKPKTETQEETKSKAADCPKNLDESKTLYVCEKCDVHFLCYNSLRSHFRSKHPCKKIIRCKHCKLRFNPKTLMKHQVLHHQKTNTKASDFCIKLTKTEKYSGKLYECDECKTVFLTDGGLSSHKARAKTKATDPHNRRSCTKCNKCGYTFIENSMPMHKLVHHKKMKLKREDFLICCYKRKKAFYKRSKKSTYQESAVSKSSDDDEDNQSDYNERDGYETIDTADDSTTLDEAEESVDVEKLSNKKDKQQDSYDAIDMADKTTSLNKTEGPIINAKLSNKKDKNIYEFSNIIFKCEVCGTHALGDREQHVLGHSSRQKNPFVDTRDPETCFCGLLFSFNCIAKHHKIHHEKQNLTRDDLYIVKQKVYDGDTVGSNHVYRCGVCKINYFKLENLKKHLSVVEHLAFKKTCSQCGLIFSVSGISRHVTLHHDIMKLNRAEDYVVLESEGDKVRILKCSDENVTTDKQEEMTGQEDIDSSEKIYQKVTRLKDHSKAGNDETAEIVSEKSLCQSNQKRPKHILYRCTKCQCCFFTLATLKSHKYTCKTSPAPKIKCDQCTLKFYKPSLLRHMKLHEKEKDLTLDDFIIEDGRTLPTIVNDESKALLEISEELSTLDTDLHNNNLFKCSTCSVHFMLEKSLNAHVNDPKTLTKSTCTFCALTFLVTTLPTHVYIHHEKMNLATEDFKITSKEEIMDHEIKDNVNETDDDDDVTICSEESESTLAAGQVESSQNNDESLVKESVVASADSIELDEPDSVVLDEDNSLEQSKSFENEDNTQSGSSVKNSDSPMIKLYKCAECNVCFLSQTSCYRHVTKHTPIEPKDYIACKLCGYQFLVLNNCLHKHITKHHKESFKPEYVLIEEYHPNLLSHGTPKIDIYFGSDKVQSKLISTTSEGNVSAELSEDNNDEQMSDNGVVDLDKGSDTAAVDSSNNKEVILIE